MGGNNPSSPLFSRGRVRIEGGLLWTRLHDEPRLTESIVFRPADGPDLSAPLRWLVRVVYTHNPFYLLSAWLDFTGLRFSFDTSGRTFQTEALMLGLIGYTTLLALAAWVLIRVGKVWEDVRGADCCWCS